MRSIPTIDPLQFQCDTKVPVASSADNPASVASYQSAVDNYERSFGESLSETKSYLKKFKIQVWNAKLSAKYTLSATYLIHALNKKVESNIKMTSSMHPNVAVTPKDDLLVFAFCQVYKCRIFLFSSRAKPEIVTPNDNHDSAAIPSFAVLKHCNSFIGKTTWYELKFNNNLKDRSRVDETLATEDTLFAQKRGAEESKPRLKKHVLGSSVDGQILQLLREEVFSIFDKRWLAFVKKHTNLTNEETISSFLSTLPAKSLPNGVVPIVKAKIEKMMRDNEIPGSVPQSPMWVHKRIETMKKKNEVSIEGFINDFATNLDVSKVRPPIQVAEHADQDAGGNTGEDAAGEVSEDFEVDKDDFRVVGRTLKRVINNHVPHDEVIEKFDSLQANCEEVITGLSKAVKILTTMVLSGDKSITNGADASLFDLNKLDLHKNNIFPGKEKIAILDDASIKYIEKSNIFPLRTILEHHVYLCRREIFTKRQAPNHQCY